MAQARPKVFVGSSSEAKNVVDAFAQVLQDDARVIPWWLAPQFEPSKSTLESLSRAVDEYDFGLFILSPSDTITSRGVTGKSARDNVILELGLFLGALGSDRTFAAIQRADSDADRVKLISDLAGIHTPQFSNASADDLISSVNIAAEPIRRAIKEHGRYMPRIALIKGWHWANDLPDKPLSVTVRTSEIKQRKDKFKGKSLVLVARKRDQTVNWEEDPQIVRSAPRKITPYLQDDPVLLAPVQESLNLKKGDIIEGHLMLVPDSLDIAQMKTMEEMMDAGCHRVDSCGVTVKELQST